MTQAHMHMLDIPTGKEGSPADQADEWLAYLYSGLATAEGEAAFSAWFKKSEQNRAAWQQADEGWQSIDAAVAPEAVPVPNNIGVAVESPVVPLKQPMYRKVMVFASLAASFLVAAILWQNSFKSPAKINHYTSQTGEIKTVELADGSRITLGGASALMTVFSEGERQIELTRGGAYFDVAADSARPFTVRSGDTEVRVLGTAFDMAHSEEGVRVAVADGRVEVRAAEGAAKQRSSLQLTPGQKLFVESGGRFGDVQAFEVDHAFTWRTGMLQYYAEPLAHVVEEVNRYRTNKILLASEELGKTRITISMPADQTNLLITGLLATKPVEIEDTVAGTLIREKQRENAGLEN